MSGDDLGEQALPPRSATPQRWDATVAEAKYYWYDLLVNDQQIPDFRDPIGRYQRRMQFALDATMEKRLLFFVVSRQRLRFDVKKGASWGFFGLKLSVPILVGVEGRRESITMELEVPFEATVKKPVVQLYDKYITLNWTSITETYSVHDLLQRFPHDMSFPSYVHYVGQTRDPQAKLAKGRHMAVNHIVEGNDPGYDTFLLIKRMNVKVDSNATDMASEASIRTQVDILEAVLIRYFEGEKPQGRSMIELNTRRDRLAELVDTYQLQSLTIDLGFQDADNFHDLQSETVPPSRRHLLECTFDGGEITIQRLADDARPLVELEA